MYRPLVADGSPDPRSPLELLSALAVEEHEVTATLRHVEVYTMEGLLTLLWHGDSEAERVLVTCGGGMGSLLGPARSLYAVLGARLWSDHGIGTVRVGYRRPNHLPRCVHDVAAAADIASRQGGRRFVMMGHSFGGAVAIQAGIVLAEHCAGVVTLSTQSAGCEDAARLTAPLLLIHGDVDEILPPETSYIVQALTGHGDIVVLSGEGHLLRDAHDELIVHLLEWIPARLAV
jgi:pimeloyl-ACP methyl ester carboxylesterase